MSELKDAIEKMKGLPGHYLHPLVEAVVHKLAEEVKKLGERLEALDRKEHD